MSVDEKLQKIFREVFKDPTLEISNELMPKNVREWNSFNHISMLMQVEEEFGISFTTKEIGLLTQVSTLKESILSKIASD